MYTSDEHVSSYHYICVLILRVCVCVVLLVFWPRTIIYVSSYYEHMCPRITMYASSYYVCVLMPLYVCPHIMSMCVLVLLYMRPHTTTICVCSCSMPVLLLVKMCLDTASMCPHTTLYASSYHSMSVLIALVCRKASYSSCMP
jgi:hypothetical protein